MKKTKKFLTLALTGVMMMGAVIIFSPAPKAAANNWCHEGAADYSVSATKDCSHCTYHGICYGIKCAACGNTVYTCTNCGKKI